MGFHATALQRVCMMSLRMGVADFISYSAMLRSLPVVANKSDSTYKMAELTALTECQATVQGMQLTLGMASACCHVRHAIMHQVMLSSMYGYITD